MLKSEICHKDLKEVGADPFWQEDSNLLLKILTINEVLPFRDQGSIRDL
jgi:hypothetical protein